MNAKDKSTFAEPVEYDGHKEDWIIRYLHICMCEMNMTYLQCEDYFRSVLGVKDWKVYAYRRVNNNVVAVYSPRESQALIYFLDELHKLRAGYELHLVKLKGKKKKR